MSDFNPLRECPQKPSFKPNDVLVIFGEVFDTGYVNGLIEAAQKAGLKVIYSTVGRRDSDHTLRALNAEELAQKTKPLINVPLEAGFDLAMGPDSKRTVDHLQGFKMSEWQNIELAWTDIEVHRKNGVEDFRKRTKTWVQEMEKMIPADANVIFAHTMAGGFPRAKIVMPVANKVFKGFGERYQSSLEFWETDLGRLCAESFLEVTGETFRHLIELTTDFREMRKKAGHKVSYLAYGYHGTEVMIGGEYHWQSYSPYLQGWAKIRLEQIAQESHAKGISAGVFNCPEILTNSTTIFLGVEVSLYPLLGALQKTRKHDGVVKNSLAKLKPEHNLKEVMEWTDGYFSNPTMKEWNRHIKDWPAHNGPQQMELMRQSSSHLIAMHKSEDDLMTRTLSDLVFQSCGQIMLYESQNIRKPVWWIGHDVIANTAL